MPFTAGIHGAVVAKNWTVGLNTILASPKPPRVGPPSADACTCVAAALGPTGFGPHICIAAPSVLCRKPTGRSSPTRRLNQRHHDCPFYSAWRACCRRAHAICISTVRSRWSRVTMPSASEARSANYRARAEQPLAVADPSCLAQVRLRHEVAASCWLELAAFEDRRTALGRQLADHLGAAEPPFFGLTRERAGRCATLSLRSPPEGLSANSGPPAERLP
jgi:hypothetical protein